MSPSRESASGGRRPDRLQATLWCASLALLVLSVHASAQEIPAQATPGGALPQPRDQWELKQPRQPVLEIPPVIERPLSEDEGPRVVVELFAVQFPEVAKLPGLRARLVAQAQAVVEAQLAAQPNDGFTLAGLERVAAAVANALRESGLILAQAYVPVQTVTDGVVEIHVLEGRLGDVHPEGNKRYLARSLREPFEALIGRPVVQSELERALLRLSDYPGLVVSGVLRAGTRPGETQLSLRVSEERVFESAIELDNHGTDFSGETRAQFSFTWNNPTGAGDRVFGRILQSFDPANNTYGGLTYERPLFNHLVNAGISVLTSDYDVGEPFKGLVIGGRANIATAYLSHQLKLSRSLNLRDRFALSVKRAQVDVLDSRRSEDNLTVFEAGLGFDWVEVRGKSVTQGYFAYSRGLDGVFGAMQENDQKTPPSSVLGGSGERAGGRFDKWTLQFARRQFLTDTQSLQLRLYVQYSSDLLTSLEQLALGGPNSVRAYSPSEVLVDMGGFASLEWISAVGKFFEFSLFAEYGGGKLTDPRASQDETTNISGYGFGLDLNLPNVRARLDVAKPLSELDPSNGRDPQYYFTFSYEF